MDLSFIFIIMSLIRFLPVIIIILIILYLILRIIYWVLKHTIYKKSKEEPRKNVYIPQRQIIRRIKKIKIN